MLPQVKEYIEAKKLIVPGDRIVVGVSGGADSICLLLLLLELRSVYKLEILVAHLHHGIRGEAADQDERYVRNFCGIRKIPCCMERVCIAERSKQWGCSEEEAGRKARYSFFMKLCNQYDYDKIAVAHNKNDNAETVLFHLVRGSGLKGLGGIAPKRGQIIRPLLETERAQIEAYLEEKKIRVCSDHTNFENKYHRNRIRNRVIPELVTINAGAMEHIVAASLMLNEVYEYLEKQVNILLKEYGSFLGSAPSFRYHLQKDGFVTADLVLQRLAFMQILNQMTEEKKDFQAVHIELLLRLLEKQVGKKVMLPHEILVERTYFGLTFFKQSKQKELILYKEEEISSFPFVYDFDLTSFQLHLFVIEYKKSMRIPKKSYTKWFDYDKIENTLFIRTRRKGDYFYINHMNSSKEEPILCQKRKSLKSFFIDAKIPKEERDTIPLLAEGSHVLWIPGEKASEAYRIEDTTKRVLIAKLHNDNGKEGELPWRKRSVY